MSKPALDTDKLLALCEIMRTVHALADYAWPRDDSGVSEMKDEGLRLIIDIQEQASRALGLPEDLDLMTGNPEIDL
jgi:hypothetical protein